MSAEIRALLERTGRLHTNDTQDVGHISDFWRSRILELCETIDALPTNVGELLAQECWNHGQTHHRLAARVAEVRELQERLAAKEAEVERALQRARDAVRLVEDAVPRMRTLNNAMSPDWLRRADEFLGS